MADGGTCVVDTLTGRWIRRRRCYYRNRVRKLGFYITNNMCDTIQSDVLGVNPESLVGVTSFHVFKSFILLVIVFGRYSIFLRVGAEAVGPAVNIGSIF